MDDVYGFDERTAFVLKRVAQNHQEEGNKANLSEMPRIPVFAMGKVKTSQISAGSTSSPTTGTVTVYTFVGGTPRAQQDLTVYNVHDSALPVDTYVWIADTGYDWLIVAAINYCP